MGLFNASYVMGMKEHERLNIERPVARSRGAAKLDNLEVDNLEYRELKTELSVAPSLPSAKVLVLQANVLFVNRFGGSLGGPYKETLCLEIFYLEIL